LAALRIAAAAVPFAWAAPAAADPIDRWAALIAEASSRFGIPADWIRRVMRAESGGRTMLDAQPIVSSAGAVGLMQLMPGTWRDMRALLGLGSDPHDPRDNILAGTAYLRLMYDRFGYPGLFAAYNAGPARYGGFLTGAQPLPAETRSYVAQVAPTRPRRTAIAPTPSADLFAVSRSAAPAGRQGLARIPSAGLFVELGGPPQR
jgi:soluble lytic murein transglycosylase-like protein